MTTESEPEALDTGATELTHWLVSLVLNRQNGELAQLRRTAVTNTRIRAGWYAPSQDEREVYEYVAFLFALYHRGVGRPTRGRGSLGAAVRRIGGPAGRGPGDPGAARLIDRIVSSRRVPERHLQHAIARLRACEQQPPSWTGLVLDLTRWDDRKARIAYRWAVEFHEPHDAGGKSAKKADGKTTSQKGSST
ncbi:MULTISPECIES: type I-E CRISPR-associated protein Cse2/CasB [unclassified Streptomyces]|uniref:type I-E CRISPR-associated protein Cse2/CasB n=1 Tax=Streptomyces sp. NPDC055082 TaxID=3365718 RepID=UPI0037D80489